MANLSITSTDVHPVRVYEQLTGPVAEAIDAGEVVRMDASTGKFTLANATDLTEGAIVGICVKSAAVGLAATVVVKGIVDLGDALTAESYGEILYLSDTDGAMDDGDGSPTETVPVGIVVPGFVNGASAADKLFYVGMVPHAAVAAAIAAAVA